MAKKRTRVDATQETEIAVEHVINPQRGQLYIPTQREQQLVGDVFTKFTASADERNSSFAYFDGRNLVDYINDSVRRFTTNVDIRDGIEDWQARVHDQFTRNKVLAIHGKIMSVLPIANFVSRGDEDIKKASILNDLYQFSEDRDGYEEFMHYFILEAIVKGTAIGYEGVEDYKCTHRIVRGVGDNIKVDEKEGREVKLFAELVPLEEFYPSSVSIKSIKEMPYCFWRKEYSYGEFISRFGMYAKSEYVQPHNVTMDREERPFYSDFISTGTNPGNVEVIRYYNAIDDAFVIIANGIWLNPIGESAISPLPFNHKKLPFFDVRFDFLGPWFYGKSMPDRLKSMQDVLNVLTNMMLDQSFLSIFSPMLVNGADGIEDDYMRPGRRISVDTQGLPINQVFAKLDVGTPNGWHQFILEYTRRVMEEASIDKVSQGIAGAGDRTTAQEIRVAAEGVASALGIFGRMLNIGLKQKATLRASNILQFWTDPNTPMLSGVLGVDGGNMFKKAFNLFKVNNVVLSDGKRGTRIVAMFADKDSIPELKQLAARERVMREINKTEVEYLPMVNTYIRNLDFDTRIVMDTRKELTKDLDKAIQLEKIRVYATMFPQGTFDMMELAAQTAEKMGDDPTKVLSQDGMKNYLAQILNKPQENQPQSNVMQNMVDTGANGLDGGKQQLAQLGSSMLG